MRKQMSWEELNQSLNSESVSPGDKGWNICHFLQANIGEQLPSSTARSLLAHYMQLPLMRPSLLHSVMLGVALKMAEMYPDFKLAGFVNLWGIVHLRPEDRQRTQAADGKTFSSLAERTARSILRYRIAHPAEAIDPAVLAFAESEGEKIGFRPIQRMVAVKMFETNKNGRKMRMVKLVGADGSELSADWHLFHSKPWEIAGKMYDVLPRESATSGNVRVDTVALSSLPVAEVFGRRIGFVDRYDAPHKHYHIFDAESGHYVAEAPQIRIAQGGFVWFAPVVPAQDKFKSAIVLAPETVEAGSEAFGVKDARITYVNTAKGYFAYERTDGEQGFCKLDLLPAPPIVGNRLRLIIYLRRGKDGEKRPYVGKIL